MKLYKKKTIMLPVICLSAVALATVGFSTWIIGAQDKDDTVSLTATVGEVTDQRLSFEVKLGEKDAETPNADTIDLAFDAKQNSKGSITSSENSEKMSFSYLITITPTVEDDVDFTSDVSSIIDQIKITLSGDGLSTLVGSETSGDANDDYLTLPVETVGTAETFILAANLTNEYTTTENYTNEEYVQYSQTVALTANQITIKGNIGFGWGAAFNNYNPVEADEHTTELLTEAKVAENLKAFKTASSSLESLSLKFDLITK